MTAVNLVGGADIRAHRHAPPDLFVACALEICALEICGLVICSLVICSVGARYSTL